MIPWYALNRLETNWTEPDSFVPERWIDNQLYPNDDKAAFAPFSLGPRNCIGRK
jgi:cytochrome P450